MKNKTTMKNGAKTIDITMKSQAKTIDKTMDSQAQTIDKTRKTNQHTSKNNEETRQNNEHKGNTKEKLMESRTEHCKTEPTPWTKQGQQYRAGRPWKIQPGREERNC